MQFSAGSAAAAAAQYLLHKLASKRVCKKLASRISLLRSIFSANSYQIEIRWSQETILACSHQNFGKKIFSNMFDVYNLPPLNRNTCGFASCTWVRGVGAGKRGRNGQEILFLVLREKTSNVTIQKKNLNKKLERLGSPSGGGRLLGRKSQWDWR